MEILIEIIGSLLEELFGMTIESRRVPRVVKTVLTSLVCLPFAVIGLLLIISGLRKGNRGTAVAGGLIALLMGWLYFLGLRRIWKR
ncbi:MAG: hypothetical protein II723_05170 [Oscillospiraceae bacterium]|nr:hypothetical protein [Oscillospiraceae bacterium]